MQLELFHMTRKELYLMCEAHWEANPCKETLAALMVARDIWEERG